MLLNKKYYGSRLDNLKRRNMLMESVIAVGATGSGVAGWAVWQTEQGALVWAVISGVSILLAVIKPFLKLVDRIENYGKLFGEYAKAYVSLKFLVEDLQVRRVVSDEDIKIFVQIRNRAAELISLDDPNPDPRFVRTLQQEVNTEIPINQLWVP